MFVVRLVGLATAIVLAVALLLWMFTGERKWLLLAWRVFKVALAVIVLVLLLLAGERFLAAA